MQISPYENGVHSIAEGLRSLAGFFERQNEPYLMKDAIIRLHHGLETLFKDILFQRNPIFIIADKLTVSQVLTCYKKFYEGHNDYLLDDILTITPLEALQRIKDLHFSTISEKEYAQLTTAFKEINIVRNSLQHFAVVLRPDIIIRTLGNLIPKSVKLIKSCYRNNNDSPIAEKISLIPHTHLRNMGHYYSNDIDADLVKIYDQASEIIQLLEDRYDNLLIEAVKKFKRTSFKSQKTTFTLRDHGQAGPRPHMPEVSFEGWLNEDPSRYGGPTLNSNGTYNENPYTGEIKLSKIDLPPHQEDSYRHQRVKLTICAKSMIKITDPGIAIKIPEAEDYIPFLRTPIITSQLELEIEALILKDSTHLLIEKIDTLSGYIITTLESSAFGDPAEKSSICGVQKIELTQTNTDIQFHGFLGSNGTIRSNYILNIKLEDTADLIFN